MFYPQSSAKGHTRMKQSVFGPQVNFLIHDPSNTHSTVKDWRNLQKMKLNEPRREGRNLVSIKPCKQSQHAKLYSDLLQAKIEETFDSPGLPPGWGLHFCIRGTPQREGGRRCSTRQLSLLIIVIICVRHHHHHHLCPSLCRLILPSNRTIVLTNCVSP